MCRLVDDSSVSPVLDEAHTPIDRSGAGWIALLVGQEDLFSLLVYSVAQFTALPVDAVTGKNASGNGCTL